MTDVSNADTSFDFLDMGPVVEELSVPIDTVVPPAPDTPIPPPPAPPAPTPGAPVVPPAPAASPEPGAPPAGYVPLSALEDERRKRQAAQREADALRAPPAPPPTITSDPDGWARQQEAKLEADRRSMRLEFSGRAAESVYGKETLTAAMEWGRAARDPYLQAKFEASDDPYATLVAEYRTAQRLQVIGDNEPTNWALEYAKAQGWAPPAGTEQQLTTPATPAVAVQPAQPAAVARPTPSLARAPSASAPAATPEVEEKDIVGGLWEK